MSSLLPPRGGGPHSPYRRRRPPPAREARRRAAAAPPERAPRNGKAKRDQSSATLAPYNARLSFNSNMQRLGRTLEVIAWAAFFLVAGAVLILRYVALPQIERLRPDIVSLVSEIVGRPVKIGGIEAQWLGLRPQINFTDVRIYDAEGREALVLPAVENILSWRSLAHGQLRLHALRIEGPRLAVRRDSAGAFYVAGMKLSPAAGEDGFGDWLLGQEEIEVRNAEIEWRDEQRAAAPLTLSAINLRLKNEGERHSIGLAGRLPE